MVQGSGFWVLGSVAVLGFRVRGSGFGSGFFGSGFFGSGFGSRFEPGTPNPEPGTASEPSTEHPEP